MVCLELLTCQEQQQPPEIRTFPKKDPDNHCNGKVHRQDKYCQRPAGWGTDHPKSGRCKLHGGCSTGRRSGELRYSEFVPTAIVAKYEEFAIEADIDIKSLNDEIALIRSRIASLQETIDIIENNPALQHDQKDTLQNQIDGKILQFTELVRRLVETKQKVEENVKSKTNVDIIMKIVDFFISIVDKTVKDTEVKRSIGIELRRLNQTELGIGSRN